jgi:hypothetical protein
VKPRLTPTYTASGLISPQAVPGLVITRKFFVRPPFDPNCATSAVATFFGIFPGVLLA